MGTSSGPPKGTYKKIFNLKGAPIYPNELKNNGCVKPFQQGRLELYNGLIFYYNTPHIYRVRKLGLILVPVRFIRVVVSACYLHLLARSLMSHSRCFI